MDDPEQHVDTELPEWLQPTTEGFRRRSSTSSSTDVCLADVEIQPPALPLFLPRILQQNRLQTKQNESTLYSHIFPKTRIAKHAEESCESANAEDILTIWRTEFRLPKDLVI